MRHVVWIFAHQDDEVAAAPRILASRRRGDRVTCVFLTDGGAPAVRNGESVRALATLGVTDVVFLGYPDGGLRLHREAALRELDERVGHVDEAGTLAWEGGHHDHDAAHLVALAFAQRRGIELFEVPLYNGYGVPGPFYRVMRPIGDGWERTKITFDDALRTLLLTRFYRSQRRSWIGLLPEAIVRLLILRRTYVRRADAKRAEQPPHRGRLFYERRFGVSREQ